MRWGTRFQLRCLLGQPLTVAAGSLVTGELRLAAHKRQSYDVHLTLCAPPLAPGGAPQTARPQHLPPYCVLFFLSVHSVARNPLLAHVCWEVLSWSPVTCPLLLLVTVMVWSYGVARSETGIAPSMRALLRALPRCDRGAAGALQARLEGTLLPSAERVELPGRDHPRPAAGRGLGPCAQQRRRAHWRARVGSAGEGPCQACWRVRALGLWCTQPYMRGKLPITMPGYLRMLCDKECAEGYLACGSMRADCLIMPRERYP